MSRSYVLTGKASFKDANISVNRGKKITSDEYAELSTASKAFFTSEDDISQVVQKKEIQVEIQVVMVEVKIMGLMVL